MKFLHLFINLALLLAFSGCVTMYTRKDFIGNNNSPYFFTFLKSELNIEKYGLLLNQPADLVINQNNTNPLKYLDGTLISDKSKLYFIYYIYDKGLFSTVLSIKLNEIEDIKLILSNKTSFLIITKNDNSFNQFRSAKIDFPFYNNEETTNLYKNMSEILKK